VSPFFRVETRRAPSRPAPLLVWTPPPELGRPRQRTGHPFGHDGLDLPKPDGVGLRHRPGLLRRLGRALLGRPEHRVA
jgi:hypothetical protein